MARAGQDVYRRLRADIIGGELAGGEKLREEELAGRYEVSRTPIREAFRRLQAEGLVEIRRHRGARVVDWADLDIDSIYQLRAHVESLVARRAAERITPQEIERLRGVSNQIEQIVDVMAEESASDAIEKIATLNAELHGTVAEIAGGHHIQAVRNVIVVLPLVLRMIAGYRPEDQRRSVGHHQELLHAFQVRDPDWAAAVMQAHVQSAKQILLRDLGNGLRSQTESEEPTGQEPSR